MNGHINDDQGCAAGEAAGRPNYPVEFKVFRQDLRNLREYAPIFALSPGHADAADEEELAELGRLELWSSEHLDGKRLLGLAWAGDRFVLSHFVGAVWLDEEESVPLVVRTKLCTDELAADPVAMYLEACSLGQITDGLFGCEPERSVIDGVELPQVTLLQVAVFLNELVYFVRKHLRQGFIRVRDNLLGKVKGKILVSENIRQNVVKGRADRIFCQYHVIDIDTVPNQILRAALTLCMKYLGLPEAQQPSYKSLREWARICDSALAGVTDRRITQADFNAVNYSGLMGKYKPIHRLAKMILRRLHTDGTGAVDVRSTVTVPFWLDMNALFEKYVEAKLVQEGVVFEPQESLRVREGNLRFQCRPDFIIGNGSVVLDAKYKAILDNRIDEDGTLDIEPIGTNRAGVPEIPNYVIRNTIHADYYQIIAYSLLITQRENREAGAEMTPASVVCLVVPVLPSGQSNNTFLNEGFIKLAGNNGFGEFNEWVKGCCPYFELQLAYGRDQTEGLPESRMLLVAVLPCYLPTS